MTDSVFLQWIHDRLCSVHGERENYDYMLRLKQIIRQRQADEIPAEKREGHYDEFNTHRHIVV